VAVTSFTREAQHLLRDPSHLSWSIVVLLAFAFYVYAVEVERQNWNAVLAGLAFWLMDWANEVGNALVLHFSHRAALWTVTGSTSYLILIGLTIEISLLFLVNGVVFVKFLPARRDARLFGINNRWALALAFSLVSVGVEELLHEAGVFHWEYWWWNVPFIPLIVIFGYLTFYVVAFTVFDMRARSRQLRVVGGLAALDAAALIAFGPILGWI